MTPRTLVALLALPALLAGACMRADDPVVSGPPRPSTTAAPTTTSTEALVPTTTVPPVLAQVDPLPGGPVRALTTPSGVVVPVLGGAEGAWSVRTPCGRVATVATGAPHSGAHVVLDAGHGGVEPGAVGPGGLQEKVLNLAVTERAARLLREAGLSVLLTRTGDYRVPLSTRAEIATALAPRAFVSIHFNAAPDGDWPRPGAETYFQVSSPESKRLAGLIWEEVVSALERFDVAWVADTDAGAKYRLNSRGGDYYGIIRRPAGVTSVLAELGFVSNPAEEALFSSEEGQEAAAAGVARGVLRHLRGDQPRPEAFTEPYPRESPAGSGGGADRCEDPPL